jgi:hypothetical protein
MKKTTTIITLAALTLMGGNAHGQLGKLKNKLNGKSSGGGGGFEVLDSETDEFGITGQYYSLTDNKAFGLRFVKEEDGKIVNEIHYFDKKVTGDPALKLSLKESYLKKNDVKLFYKWVSASASGYVEMVEIDKNIFAQVAQTSQSLQDGPATLDANRKVKDVFAKDKASFETWDLETAQAKLDMIINSLNSEKWEKEKAKWMKSDVFAKNVDKVVFADQWYHLQKQGYPNKLGVDGKSFKTELDMAGNMNFMGFFSYPPAVKYPGQQINIEYEMNGQKTNREELRKSSSAWSNMVKIVETKDWDYNQSPTRAVREYNQYHSQYVQDYAAIQCLYNNKDKFKVGESYPMTVRIYAHKDGENGDLIAEGVVNLKYSKEAKLAFEGNPADPTKKGVWGHFEEFLDE